MINTLLIINSILVATCLYFIKDVHSDFKQMTKKVQELEKNFGEQSAKTNTEMKSVEKRVDNLEHKAV